MPLAWLRTLTILIVTAAAWPAAAAAQFALRSTVEGTVTDSSDAAVPGATVTLTETSRNLVHATVTDENGAYSFSNVVSGVYKVTAELPGFATAESSDVTVGTASTVRVDLVLQVGGLEVAVQVTDSVPLVSTDHIAVGATVNKTVIESVPSKGRNFTSFAQFAPGISTQPRSDTAGTYSAGAHHVIGGIDYVAGGGGNNAFYINGVNANDNYVGGQSYAPSLEALDEIKVDVANFSAANGRDLSSLSVTTRAGTNQLRGSIYDYFEDEALNAWDPLQKQRVAPGTRKPTLTRHQYGGNIGGPLIRNRLFGFLNFEQTYNHRGDEPWFVRVPTAAERQGDFSELLRRFPGDPNYVIYNPFSTVINEDGESVRQPVPNNDLRNITRPDGSPAIDPRAQEMLNLFPMPNYSDPTDPDNLANHQALYTEKFSSWRADGRVDLSLTPNDSLYVNVSRSKGSDRNSGGPYPEIISWNVSDTSWQTSVNYARIFSPTFTNELVVAVGKGELCIPDDRSVEYMRRTDTLRTKHFRNLGAGDDLGLFAMDIAGYWTFGSFETFCATNPSFQVSSNLNWVSGRHSVKAGFNFFRKEEIDFDYIRFVGFDSTFTRSGTADGSIGGDSVASFLLGLPSYMQQRYNLTEGDDRLNFVMPYWGFYVEDKWQITDTWTLSAGLRYDLGIPTYSGNKYGNAIVDMSYPGWQLAIPGRTPGLDHHYLPADKNNFAPRISLAYEVQPGWVFRGGWGIFYDLGLTTVGSVRIGEAGFGGVPGYVGDFYGNSRFGVHDDVPVMTLDDIFPAPATIPVGTYPISTGPGTGYFDYQANIRYLDRDSNGTPYYHRFVVSTEKQIGPRTAVTFFYTGSRGRQLPYWENQNLPPYRTGWPSDFDFNAARPNNNGRFGDVRVLRHGLTSTYNAGTVRIDQRLANGLQFLAHYTYSKAITDRMWLDGGIDESRQGWDWNRHLGRGEASFSHPHRLVVAGTWDIPFGHDLRGLARGVLHGWRISGVYTIESGDALTVLNGQSSARDFEPDMPDVIGDPNNGPKTPNQWFNTAAFSDPGQDVKGNARPGIVRGPGMNNLDLSFGKTFPTGFGTSVIFRADFFNALNHPQWRYVDTTFSTAEGSTFGRVTEARDARIVQLSLKFMF
ncbi:MAG TPA: carboxypeptidase regulatory-like domain-containing protein [Vicinamibacterales bacterium]|nr:carboxypeptidase regulatory-like domain-containing protein [Vicinamibacterales bacterium]